jgi:hypothetical protein
VPISPARKASEYSRTATSICFVPLRGTGAGFAEGDRETAEAVADPRATDPEGCAAMVVGDDAGVGVAAALVGAAEG